MAEKIIYEVLYGDDSRFNFRTKADTVKFGIGNQEIRVEDIDQLPGVVAEAKGTQLLPRLAFETYDTEISTLLELFGAQARRTAYGMSLEYVDVDLKSIAERLRMHPLGRTTYDKDITIWKTTPIADVDLNFSSASFNSIPLSWNIFPDESQSNNPTCFIGDWSQLAATPLAVLLTMDNMVRMPLYSLGAITLLVAQSDRLDGFEIYGAEDTGFTCDVDNGAGYLATDTTIHVDGVTGGTLAAGMILKNASGGYFYIHTVTETAPGDYDLGVYRGVFTATASDDALVDDETLQVMDNDAWDFVPARDRGTWASSVAANVTAGNTYQADSDEDNKGVLVRLQAGASNITLTSGAVASSNLVVS